MTRAFWIFSSILLWFVIINSIAFAQVPRELNYQGFLTDTIGNPVPDGAYDITFSLFDAEAGGSLLWLEAHSAVPVTNGTFDVILGQMKLFPDSTFAGDEVYLGIQVGADPELTPRTKMTASAYAIHAQYADFVTTDSYLRKSGGTLTGDLYFDYGDNGSVEGFMDLGQIGGGGDEYMNMELYSDESMTTKIWGNTYGEAALYNSDNGDLRADLAALTNGGRLGLYDLSADQKIRLDAGLDGNNSVQIPEDAIDAMEMLNEPGISYQINATGVQLTSNTVMTDLVTLSVTIPDDGFLYVSGRCHVQIVDSGNYNGALIQIDEFEGGGPTGYSTTVASRSVFPDTTRLSVYTDRVYWKEEGTYTFRLEGMLLIGREYRTRTYQNSITAMYFPTSYGDIKGLLSDPGENPEAYPVEIKNEGQDIGETVYETDLRWYEMRAREAKQREAQARLRAMETEMEYIRAKEAAASQNE